MLLHLRKVRMKRCSHCGEVKDEGEFHPARKGLQTICKECHREVDRASYERRRGRGDVLVRRNFVDKFILDSF